MFFVIRCYLKYQTYLFFTLSLSPLLFVFSRKQALIIYQHLLLHSHTHIPDCLLTYIHRTQVFFYFKVVSCVLTVLRPIFWNIPTPVSWNWGLDNRHRVSSAGIVKQSIGLGTELEYTVKKRFASFPSLAGMSITNSPWAGIMTS